MMSPGKTENFNFLPFLKESPAGLPSVKVRVSEGSSKKTVYSKAI